MKNERESPSLTFLKTSYGFKVYGENWGSISHWYGYIGRIYWSGYHKVWKFKQSAFVVNMWQEEVEQIAEFMKKLVIKDA